MLLIVALSARLKLLTPGPKNSTNLSTTPFFLSIWVQRSTKSVAVEPFLSYPVSLKPITSGSTIDVHCPSITASASIPPTPQPTTPKPLIMVVWESVPTTLSGYKSPFLSKTTLAKYYKFTWCTIPKLHYRVFTLEAQLKSFQRQSVPTSRTRIFHDFFQTPFPNFFSRSLHSSHNQLVRSDL